MPRVRNVWIVDVNRRMRHEEKERDSSVKSWAGIILYWKIEENIFLLLLYIFCMSSNEWKGIFFLKMILIYNGHFSFIL